MGNFFSEIGDAVSGIVDWVGDKLGDTVDWIKEDPMEALAVAAIAYGGYSMYAANAGASTAAGVAGEASAMGSGSVAAGGEAATAAAGEAVAGEALAGAATEASVGEGLLTASEMQGMTAGELAAQDAAFNAAGQTAAGEAVNAGTTIVNGAYQAPAPFWSMDNPYAWMVGGQAVSTAGNMWSADQQREEDKKRYNAKSYYGVSNAGVSDGQAAGAAEGLLQVSNDFTQNRTPQPGMLAKPGVVQAKERGKRA